MRKEQIITTNNNQMEEKGMKSRFIHFKKRFVPALSGALMGVMLMSTTCFAAGTGTSAVTQPLENLKTLSFVCSFPLFFSFFRSFLLRFQIGLSSRNSLFYVVVGIEGTERV